MKGIKIYAIISSIIIIILIIWIYLLYLTLDVAKEELSGVNIPNELVFQRGQAKDMREIANDICNQYNNQTEEINDLRELLLLEIRLNNLQGFSEGSMNHLGEKEKLLSCEDLSY